ncbi:ATP-binding cassette domain-containing protein, partial [Pseudolysinimonas sp.]
MRSDEVAIAVEGLRMSYGDREVLRGLDLEIRRGEVVALLGPNGAGKTTTVEILEGFRAPDAGRVRVLGEEPLRASESWR